MQIYLMDIIFANAEFMHVPIINAELTMFVRKQFT